jgi:hypothetical protein
VTRPRTIRSAVAAVLAVAVLSSCSTHPGSAAVVGDEKISEARLDDVASALCLAQSGGANGQSQQLASRSARQIALGVLLDSELSRQFGESEGVEPDQRQVSQALASREQVINALPRANREDFRTALREFAEGQLMVLEIGRRSLSEKGRRNVTDQQAVSEGTRLRNAWANRNLDVSVDPRYGEYTRGTLRSESGSLSVAASGRAQDGDSPNPSSGWVDSLPASQKCG